MREIAVSLRDLERVDPSVRASMLAGRVDTEHPVEGVEDTDPTCSALAFTCDALAAGVVCDLLRSMDRESGHTPVRVYVLKRGAWRRVVQSENLTVVSPEGVVELNPVLFEKRLHGGPPTAKVVRLALGRASGSDRR